jgi:bifunctional DNA-binding transcriptional regulator/antitoxin component of YhaV-PrlF toxin-antitoxin module
MKATTQLDASNRIVITRRVREAAGITRGEKLTVSAMPGRVVLEVQPNPGKVVKRGGLKIWTGEVPSLPLEEAVERARSCGR